MQKKYKTLILGYNLKHAKIFSEFSDVIIFVDNLQAMRTAVEDNNFKIISKNRNKISYIQKAHIIKSLVKKYKISIIFSNTKKDVISSKLAFIATKKNKRPLLLATFHNSLAWINKKKVNLFSKIIKFCLDGTIVLADFVYKQLISNKISPKKLLYQPNTIEYENYQYKDTYELHNPINIMYTAVVTDMKNQMLIIEMINELQKLYKFEVNICGDFLDENYHDKIIKKITKYNLNEQIHLLGRVDNIEVRKMLLNTDIYISTSRYEMSPYNILEAKASGLPILASNTTGQKDLINNNISGLLYECDNIKDAVSKLKLLISNNKLRSQLGKNARLETSNTQSYKVATQKIKKFIDDLI